MTDRRRPRRARRRALLAIAGLLVSTLGAWYHNAVDLPNMPLYAPEMLLTFVPPLALAVWWWRDPGRTVLIASWLWVILSLALGGLLSVLPLPIWPFQPAQTVTHYQAHLWYTASQIPLLVSLAWMSARSRIPRSS